MDTPGPNQAKGTDGTGQRPSLTNTHALSRLPLVSQRKTNLQIVLLLGLKFLRLSMPLIPKSRGLRSSSIVSNPTLPNPALVVGVLLVLVVPLALVVVAMLVVVRKPTSPPLKHKGAMMMMMMVTNSSIGNQKR